MRDMVPRRTEKSHTKGCVPGSPRRHGQSTDRLARRVGSFLGDARHRMIYPFFATFSCSSGLARTMQWCDVMRNKLPAFLTLGLFASVSWLAFAGCAASGADVGDGQDEGAPTEEDGRTTESMTV